MTFSLISLDVYICYDVNMLTWGLIKPLTLCNAVESRRKMVVATTEIMVEGVVFGLVFELGCSFWKGFWKEGLKEGIDRWGG
jgi:hypothetical protein